MLATNFRPLIEETLKEIIPSDAQTLFDAARYSLFSGGKRLRPLLTLAATEVMKGKVSDALHPACALELVHTYSLIHDDLPAMDNDDFRRGNPTLHKVYPESHAILTGDYLLTYAFEVLSSAPGLSADQKIALIQTLAKGAGAKGMIGGQILDLTGGTVTLEKLCTTHLYKTAALIETAVAFGGIISSASDAHLQILKQFGRDVGLAFQIIDDILDASTEDKPSYASLLGIEKAKQIADELHRSALDGIKRLPYDSSLLVELAESMINRKH